MDHPLSPNDFSRLYNTHLDACAGRWQRVGDGLGFSADDLEVIDINQRGKCEACFQELLLKWLRKDGIKTESELVEAIPPASFSVFPNRLCTAIMILLSILSAIPASHIYRWFTANPLTSAAHTLKGQYRHHPVVEFGLLDFTDNMPYINVTMKSAGSRTIVNFWEVLNDLDSKHTRSQATEPGKLERILITGHPGVGKTTLMRYLAKEWAYDRRLRSCKVLFLFQFGRLVSKDKEPQSLIDLLQLSPYKHLDLEGLSKEIQQRQGAGACFLLDSYDERIWKKDFVHQLFFEFNLYSSLSILTSRPLYKSKKQPHMMDIEMTGFKISDLEKHLTALSVDSQVTNSIIRLWNSKPHIKELCTLPLNVNRLC